MHQFVSGLVMKNITSNLIPPCLNLSSLSLSFFMSFFLSLYSTEPSDLTISYGPYPCILADASVAPRRDDVIVCRTSPGKRREEACFVVFSSLLGFFLVFCQLVPDTKKDLSFYVSRIERRTKEPGRLLLFVLDLLCGHTFLAIDRISHRLPITIPFLSLSPPCPSRRRCIFPLYRSRWLWLCGANRDVFFHLLLPR